MFLTTRYMDEAERCDHIAIIDASRIVAVGSPSELEASVGADALMVTTADDGTACEQIARGLGVERDVRPEGLRLLVTEGEAFVPRIFEHVTVRIGKVNVRRPPLTQVPPWLQVATRAKPVTYGVDFIHRVLLGDVGAHTLPRP